MDELRQLTPIGLTEMTDFLRRLRAGETSSSSDLLWSSRTSEAIRPRIELEPETFSTKYAMGEYLVDLLRPLPAEVVSDGALWSWLSLYFFDAICTPRVGGTRRVLAENLYVLTPEAAQDFRLYYRHLLRSSYVLVRQHGETAKVCLSGRPDQHGDLQEQLASRLEIASNKALFEVAFRLYFDPERQQPKRGATDRRRAGSVRRLITVAQQLDLTYDLYGMTPDEVISVLPGEFAPWLDGVPA